MPLKEQQRVTSAVTIERARPSDVETIDKLWEAGITRPGTPEKPGICFVARDQRSGEILGVAEYVRTFPPEDGTWAVTVARHARQLGLATRLLGVLADAALRDGIRNLAAFIDFDNEPTWRLLAAVGIPVRVYRMRHGAYVELDLVHLLRLYTKQTRQTEQANGEFENDHRIKVVTMLGTSCPPLVTMGARGIRES